MNSLHIVNARLLTPYRLIPQGELLIENGRIACVGQFCGSIRPEKGTARIDAHGMHLAPGFVDIHVHGGGGGDVMDAKLSSLQRICTAHAIGGTTSLLLTTLTAPLDHVAAALDTIESASHRSVLDARVLGAHLEGPFLNPMHAGAQNPESIVPPRETEYLPLLASHPSILRVTLAPEIPGGLTLAGHLRDRGILASIGHSGATYQQVLAATEAGCTHVTHMFCGMGSVTKVNGYRVSGVVESTLLLDSLTTEMIGDGHHLPPSLALLLLKAKPGAVALVTDAISATGEDLGTHQLGGLQILVEHTVPAEFEEEPPGAVAKLRDRSAFAGSVSTMNQLVRFMTQAVGVPLASAVQMATTIPARIVGRSDIGILAPGALGDVVMFDDRLDVALTAVEGRIIYRNPSHDELTWEAQGGGE